jgi:hypothetical protein
MYVFMTQKFCTTGDALKADYFMLGERGAVVFVTSELSH